jgi:hypothetical protein
VAQLARTRRIPVLTLQPHETRAHAGRSRASRVRPPWLATDFQIDREHRLPDEAYVPGLRDLLHRGSLLRERTLLERLAPQWRETMDTELRALYAWHVSPLLRRAAALLQTLAPLPSVRVIAPLTPLDSVTAYLLGLTDTRPSQALEPGAAAQAARDLANALQQWDRRVVAEVPGAVWPRVGARLLPWFDAGMLATCPDAPARPGRRFCFSGEPLWTRAPLRRDADGVSTVVLEDADRRALGWFELELHAVESQRGVAESSAGRASTSCVSAALGLAHDGYGHVHEVDQLDLGLEGWGT